MGSNPSMVEGVPHQQDGKIDNEDLTSSSSSSLVNHNNETLMEQSISSHFCAKYVKYVPELYCAIEDRTKVWWFPSDFCQSRLGDRQIGSNACTLIAVILAYRIEGQDIAIYGHLDQPLSRHLISALAESIVDGNEIHELLNTSGKLQSLDLTLPEAMKACQQYSSVFNGRAFDRRLVEWKTVFRMKELTLDLFEDLDLAVAEWDSKVSAAAVPHSNLFIVLISGGRSILCVYQQSLQKVTLIDTHCHLNCGAVVAQVVIDELQYLCHWFNVTSWKVYQNEPKSYEVSFLYFESTEHEKGKFNFRDCQSSAFIK